MKKENLVIVIAFFLLTISCSKKTQTASNISPNTIDTMPLANTIAKDDTLKIMAYNVLYYGNQCQGSPSLLDTYLETIIQYTQPDILSCEKIYTFLSTPGASGNFADEITNNVLNTAFPGQYNYATPTNQSGGKNMSVLFYNKQKLTFVKTETLVANITDFDLYKLYYNDINIQITHDTTFLYVLVNHTQSGSPSTSRDKQVSQEMTALRSKFLYFPNLINMGDFNTTGSNEAGYQSVISSSDSTTIMSDPPYYPDKILQYPGNWDASQGSVASFLTTSTRSSTVIPNTCGTGGGAKGWYDHIFISPWITNGTNYMKYIPNSYKTIGNDGNRIGLDINSQITLTNASAPPEVIDALFQFSNKYPIMIKLAVKSNRSAKSIIDPIERN